MREDRLDDATLDVAEIRRRMEQNAAGWDEALDQVATEMQRLRDVAERCENGDCDVSREVVAALMEAGGWSEIDGDGTPATVLADHVRDLGQRLSATETAARAEVVGPCGDPAEVPEVEIRPVDTPDGPRVEIAMLSHAYCWRVRSWWTPEAAAGIDADLRAALSAASTEPTEAERRAWVAESIYQRHADGWHAVMHEIIEPPCWNRSNPDDTEPLTPDQVAWMRGEPLPGGSAASAPTDEPEAQRVIWRGRVEQLFDPLVLGLKHGDRVELRAAAPGPEGSDHAG